MAADSSIVLRQAQVAHVYLNARGIGQTSRAQTALSTWRSMLWNQQSVIARYLKANGAPAYFSVGGSQHTLEKLLSLAASATTFDAFTAIAMIQTTAVGLPAQMKDRFTSLTATAVTAQDAVFRNTYKSYEEFFKMTYPEAYRGFYELENLTATYTGAELAYALQSATGAPQTSVVQPDEQIPSAVTPMTAGAFYQQSAASRLNAGTTATPVVMPGGETFLVTAPVQGQVAKASWWGNPVFLGILGAVAVSGVGFAVYRKMKRSH